MLQLKRVHGSANSSQVSESISFGISYTTTNSQLEAPTDMITSRNLGSISREVLLGDVAVLLLKSSKAV